MITINFISSKDAEEERVMHSKSENMKFTSYNDAKRVVNKLFDSLRLPYQGNSETSMRGSGLIFDLVQMMYYKCHNVDFRSGRSYIGSPDWIKRKKQK